jgi:hypothetical protein
MTTQDKLDIDKTITWLWEAVEYIDNNPPEIDGEPDWVKNVADATDVAEGWLRRIQKGELK